MVLKPQSKLKSFNQLNKKYLKKVSWEKYIRTSLIQNCISNPTFREFPS